jgi:TonB-linked SusC/RagA family outer membrane protein
MVLVACMVACLAGVVQASEGQAQELLERRVSLNLQNEPLESAIDKVSRAARVRFTYNPQIFTGSKRVSLLAQDEKLAKVLERLLEPTSITYKVVGSQVVFRKIKEKQSSSSGATEAIEFGEEAKDQFVSGTVRDENGGVLPGVSVVLKGTQRGTTTDTDGKFVLEVPGASSVLVFSFVGYSSQEVTVGNQSNLSVSLTPESKALNEVVVIGYGSVKRKDLTGAVSQIDTKDIDAFPVADVQQALRGRAPGVRVIQSSGQPGASVQVQVRGGNSFLGNNNPLYVVDGFPLTGGIDFLNPSDIATIDILKDASATAIYGARGANGVVIITTRQGKQGRSRVSLDSYYGFQNAAKRFDLLNAQQYAEVANEQLTNDGKPAQFTGSDFANTDWQDEIFQTAPIQNHVLTFSGGNDKTRYSVSGNYFKQDGIILNSGTDRGSFRFGLDQNVSDRFSFSTHFVGSRFTFANNGAKTGTGATTFCRPPSCRRPLYPCGIRTETIQM